MEISLHSWTTNNVIEYSQREDEIVSIENPMRKLLQPSVVKERPLVLLAHSTKVGVGVKRV